MSLRRRPVVLVAAVAATLVMAVALPATAVAPTETFATFSTISTGELDGTPFTVGGCGPGSLGTSDLSGSDFVPAGSATQATNSCTTSTGITIIFEQALDGIDLYVVDLPYARCADGVYDIATDAAGPLTIASGFTESSISGSTLTVPFTTPNSGVIHIAGPVTNLTLTSESVSFTGTLTLGTVHVEPTTTTTSTTSTTVAPGADVAGAGAGAAAGAVTPAFAC